MGQLWITAPVCHRNSTGFNANSPSGDNYMGSSTVWWESVRLCQAYLFNLIPLWKIINHTVVSPSKCGSQPADIKAASHAQRNSFNTYLSPIEYMLILSAFPISLKLIWQKKSFLSKQILQLAWPRLEIFEVSVSYDINNRCVECSDLLFSAESFKLVEMKLKVNNVLECGKATQCWT